MCGHQFCKACLAEAAAEMPLIPADLQDSVMRANRGVSLLTLPGRPWSGLSADPDWTTLEDVQQLEHENRDDPEVLDHPVDEDDDLGLDVRAEGLTLLGLCAIPDTGLGHSRGGPEGPQQVEWDSVPYLPQ